MTTRRLITTIDRPVSFTMEGSPETRVEPLNLALVRKHLKFSPTSEDLLLLGWIAAARAHFEEQTGRQSVDGIWEYALDDVPYEPCLELPRPPMAGDVSILYDDENGDEQTMDPDSYRVLPSFVSASAIDPYCSRGRIELVSGASWPTISTQARSLRIRRTCGYGASAEAMPALLQAALYLLVAHFHKFRSEVFEGQPLQKLPLGAETILSAFKYSALPTIAAPTTTREIVWP